MTTFALFSIPLAVAMVPRARRMVLDWWHGVELTMAEDNRD